jgi:hypothetical protein
MLYERSSLYEKVIVSTIKDKSKIPSYINENRQQYAPNYNHIFFDDNDCISFLEKHYKQKYTDAFKNMKSGAHKADLFRYAYLYKMGGLYVDVKTLFYKNVNLIIKNKSICYMVKTILKESGKYNIYNGIIYTPPKNEMILNLLNHSVNYKDEYDKYNFNLDFAYNLLNKITMDKGLPQGKNKSSISNMLDLYILEERFSTNCNKSDRYNICNYIYDVMDEPIIQVRDFNYIPNYEV